MRKTVIRLFRVSPEDQAFVWDADIKCVMQRVGMLEESNQIRRSLQKGNHRYVRTKQSMRALSWMA